MFDNLTLVGKSDSELQELLDSTGKGKTPVYKPFFRKLLAFAGDDFQGVAPIEWATVEGIAPDATRKSVIAGMKNALRADADNGAHFARIVNVQAATDDAIVLVAIRKPAENSDTENSN